MACAMRARPIEQAPSIGTGSPDSVVSSQVFISETPSPSRPRYPN